MIRKKIFLVMLLFCCISIFGQTTKTIDELNLELKTATENNDFQKAEQLKKEIQQVEEKNAKLKQLEEDKKIAIFLEKYDEVIAIQKTIDDVKNGRTTSSPTPQPTNNQTSEKLGMMSSVLSNQPAPVDFEKALLGSKQPKKNTLLSDYEYKDKVIGSMGFGFRSFEKTYTSPINPYNYSSETYTDEFAVFAFQASNHRWWANKYLTGGLFLDLNFGDYTSMQGGTQLAFLGDFDAILLPYTSFGIGFGLKDNEEIESIEDSEVVTYLPINFKLGSYLFFNQDRSFGAFVEYNIYFNNEYTPHFRFGLAWSRVKRKAKK